MTRDITDRLTLFSAGSPSLEVRRIALTMKQIEELKPPPNPAKITDSRYENYVIHYGRESWELDALDPKYLRNLIEEAIKAERDYPAWKDINAEQEGERERIALAVEKFKEE